MKLSEQLPQHAADPGTWDRISASLNALDAEASFQQSLQELPVHSPDKGTWAAISGRLNKTVYYRKVFRLVVSAAAVLLLFITVYRYPAVEPTQKHAQANTNPQLSHEQALALNTGKPTRTVINQSVSKTAPALNQNMATADSPHVPVQDQKVPVNADKNPALPLTDATMQAGSPDINELETFAASTVTMYNDSTKTLALRETVQGTNTDEQGKTTFTPEQIVAFSNPATRPYNYTSETAKASMETPGLSASNQGLNPATPAGKSKKNHFALAMGYLPENINNGTDNSVFHNVDVTASFDKEKIRFNTSLGMAYNQEQLQISMKYDVRQPVTAVGPGGKIDTLSYNVSSLKSDYGGTETHQYLTYNLGLGRRLFSIGKFSTWLNAGAGFGVRLNNPDLAAATEKSVKNQYNAFNTSIVSSKPVYNDVNVNFVTGIDFNYKIINRIILSFTPTSRWYFKPVLSLNNQPTDELTLGFKTGLKFEF